MFTDAFVTYAVECFAMRAQLSQTVYQYRYSHLGQFGLNTDQGNIIQSYNVNNNIICMRHVSLSGLPKYGVNHADELYLMWDPLYDQHRALNPSDQQMSDILISAWASFIKTGVPEVRL